MAMREVSQKQARYDDGQLEADITLQHIWAEMCAEEEQHWPVNHVKRVASGPKELADPSG